MRNILNSLLVIGMFITPAIAMDTRDRPVFQTPSSPRADDGSTTNCKWEPVACYDHPAYIECRMQNTCTHEQTVIRIPKKMIPKR